MIPVRVVQALCCAFAGLTRAGAAQQPDKAAAVIADVQGHEAFVSRERSRVRLERLDWMPAGARLETGPDSSVVVVFWSGRRWRIEERTNARVDADGIRAVRGRVVELPAFPPLPRVGAIRADQPSGAGAAVRVRGRYWTRVYPREHARTLCRATTLRFETAGRLTEFWVQVKDPQGRVVFETTILGNSVGVPPGILAPATRYAWKVEPLPPNGTPEAIGSFETLSAEIEATRDTLHASSGSRDPATLAMLAEIDWRLGLLVEAHQGFEAALAAMPMDDVWQRRVDELKALLDDEIPSRK
jgi:hypothetical protein